MPLGNARSVALVLLAACSRGEVTPEGSHAVLFENLGSLTHPVTAATPEVQAFFDQGLRLTYAFNHSEAINAFREGARRDPACAMCYWGVALALGPNINLPMDPVANQPALEAIGRAREHAPHATEKERDFIDAIATRYSAAAEAVRTSLDTAYAYAMRDLAMKYPDDDDVVTLYAEALMNLRPWDYWSPEREPQPGMSDMLAALEQIVHRSPDHPGACHFYIHAVEATYPERAVACAERLPTLMPGAGHLVHMPAHVYIRVGRYADAIEANQHAVHADETYIADVNPKGIYPIAYYPHNYHFLAFASIMAGQSEAAIAAARQVVAKLEKDVALTVPFLEGVPAYAHLALVSFGRWQDVLAEPMPDPELRTATGLTQYARGVAFAATDRAADARSALDSVRAIGTWRRGAIGEGGATALLEIAEHALQGEIALRSGNPTEAVAHFRIATSIEDGLPYDEPPPWYYPVRHSLGAALLAAGDAAEAERTYRDDLAKFPNNGWSLFGLIQSLETSGRDVDAADVRAQFTAAWAAADVQLVGSRF